MRSLGGAFCTIQCTTKEVGMAMRASPLPEGSPKPDERGGLFFEGPLFYIYIYAIIYIYIYILSTIKGE